MSAMASLGIPPEGIALVLGVDRLLDMGRTVVNVTGDSTAALYLARVEKVDLNANLLAHE
jgi:Na+/H+-dicarboxylate symporter